ncbi:MAG: DUF1513 domain-containing protein [Alphaproteobacteria bacterium]|nr:DUF1513 domain-containing protein [Alphaproteobacteria bacterium]
MALTASTGLAIDPLRVFAAASTVQEYLVVGSYTKAVRANLTQQTVKQLEIGFLAHSLLRHPKYPHRYLAMEKWGPNAAMVDFETGEVKKVLGGENQHFYGHGRYVPEKNAFYVSRVSVETGKGYLAAYDPETYEAKDAIHVCMGGLHECRRMPDNTYAVTSSGVKADDYGDPRKGKRVEPSSLRFVDIVGSGKVVRDLSIQDDKQVIGHFEITKHGQIIALSSPLSQFLGGDLRTASRNNAGYVYFSRDGKEPLKEMDWGHDLQMQIKGEILSIALNEDHTQAAVTNPLAGNVVLLDLEKQKVIKSVEAPFRGIVWDPLSKGYIGSERHLVWIAPDFSKMTKLPIENKAGYSSSHSILETV